MAQFNRLQIGRRGRQVLNEHAVIVTHVETPSLFFCRLWDDNVQFSNLNYLIANYLEKTGEKDTRLPSGQLKHQTVLVYSGIRKAWCRARIISLKHSIAKVFLMDYGSIELVLFNLQFVKEATPDIAGFNDGFGLCFPCKLSGIMPSDDTKHKSVSEWSSYANFVMEQETKDTIFALVLAGNVSSDNVVVCDLKPQRDTQNARSLSQILVNANLAYFTTLEETDSIFVMEDKENLFVTS